LEKPIAFNRRANRWPINNYHGQLQKMTRSTIKKLQNLASSTTTTTTITTITTTTFLWDSSLKLYLL